MNWMIQNDMFLYIPQLKRVFHYEIDKAIITKLSNQYEFP